MKDLLIRTSEISDTLVKMLNNQIKMEAQSSADYLAMAVWCDTNGYGNSAKFFYLQAEEEREHQLKIVHYLADMAAHPVITGLTTPRDTYGSLREIFEMMAVMEKGVTEAIHKIVGACRKEEDFATEDFLHWYVKEQREEEFVARELLNALEMLGDEKIGLAMFEDKVLHVSYEEHSAE